MKLAATADIVGTKTIRHFAEIAAMFLRDGQVIDTSWEWRPSTTTDRHLLLAFFLPDDHQYGVVERDNKKASLLTPLDEATYAAVPVPTGEAIRGALRHGADMLRKAAEQPKPTKVDPKIRFR